MSPLLRYWLIPGRLRRLPIWGQIALAVFVVCLTIVVSIAIFRIKGSVQTGPLNYAGAILLLGLPVTLSVLGTFAGAMLIAGERQKQTWEPLLLGAVSVGKLVSVKLAARLIFCLLMVLPATIWFECLMYRLIQENGFSWDQYPPTPTTFRIRTCLFLVWTFLQILGHLLPFMTLGAAVSARCRKVKDALLVSSGLLTAYGVLFWQMAISTRFQAIVNSSHPGLGLEAFRWPVVPYLSGEYSDSRDILAIGWRTTLAADLIWTLAVPAVFLTLAIAWSRLSRPSPSRRLAPV